MTLAVEPCGLCNSSCFLCVTVLRTVQYGMQNIGVALFKLLVAIGHRPQPPGDSPLHFCILSSALTLFLLARLESEQWMLSVLAHDSPTVLGG